MEALIVTNRSTLSLPFHNDLLCDYGENQRFQPTTHRFHVTQNHHYRRHLCLPTVYSSCVHRSWKIGCSHSLGSPTEREREKTFFSMRRARSVVRPVVGELLPADNGLELDVLLLLPPPPLPFERRV